MGMAISARNTMPPNVRHCAVRITPDSSTLATSRGGAVVLWVGPSADVARVGRVAALLAAEVERDDDGLLVLRKVGPTPAGFPRRTGVARKRPLG